MTIAPADVREVVLVTIRLRLLDDDIHTLRLDETDNDRHTWSIAEHALDAARARGATLANVFATAANELNRMGEGPYDPEHNGMFDPGIDHLADVPFEQFGPVPAELADTQERTLNDTRRGQTLRLLYILTNRLAGRAFDRVRQTYVERLDERGLDGSITEVGQVIGEPERVALFTAGLYGEEAL